LFDLQVLPKSGHKNYRIMIVMIKITSSIILSLSARVRCRILLNSSRQAWREISSFSFISNIRKPRPGARGPGPDSDSDCDVLPADRRGGRERMISCRISSCTVPRVASELTCRAAPTGPGSRSEDSHCPRPPGPAHWHADSESGSHGSQS
jgi:hypothetical protein